MQQQFYGVNDYCDACGSVYPKIKIMVVWCQIHHSGHTLPCNHDPPHLCDFPDVGTIHVHICHTFNDRLLKRGELVWQVGSTEWKEYRLTDDIISRPRGEMVNKLPKWVCMVKWMPGGNQLVKPRLPMCDVVGNLRRSPLKHNEFSTSDSCSV